MPSLRHHVAALALVVAGAALAASCRDFVTDDVIDAGAALCSTIETCEVTETACDRVEEYFATGEDASFAKYLDYYIEWNCGEACGSVEVCLDYPDLCEPTGRPCELDFDCCDASTGAAACRNGLCCFDFGVVCTGPEDCCPLPGGGTVDCFVGDDAPAGTPATCGGEKPCGGLRGDPCETSDDCCGKATCQRGRCQTDKCVERDAPCRGDEKCCTFGDVCEDGICKPEPAFCDQAANKQDPKCCTAQGGACRNVGGGAECCGGNGCVTQDGVEGLCLPPDECRVPGTDCDTAAECCDVGADPIRCIDVGGEKACRPIDCVFVEGAPCGENGLNCCTGLTCRPSEGGPSTCQVPCEPTACNRDVRTFGPPLDPTCALPGQEQCVADVCTADPFCCCGWWDEHCVAEAAACGNGTDPG